jgi:hypothetical protein
MPHDTATRRIYLAAILTLAAFCLHLGLEGLDQTFGPALGGAVSTSQTWFMAGWLFLGNAVLLGLSAIRVRSWSVGHLAVLGLNGLVWSAAGLSMGLPVRSLLIWAILGVVFLALTVLHVRFSARPAE